MPAECRTESCKAPLIWTVNEATGAKVPLDEAPNPEGRWVKVRVEVSEDGKKTKFVRRLKRDEDPPAGHGTYTSHFETCPEAASFSKGKKT